jgi:NhaP-type Na+/H+ or K+/H+ antiporter
MTILLAYAATLLVAVYLSERAHRTVLSTAVLFLLMGVLLGESGFDWITPAPDEPALELFADLALVSVLYTDGMRLGLSDLRQAWRLPGRALLFGLPLTLLGTALLAHFMVGLSWVESCLVGAVLSPTDPVFAAAVVGRREVPGRLRSLINIESGLNDGLALPIVLILLAVAHEQPPSIASIGLELAAGIAIGVLIPWLALQIERARFFGVAAPYEPILPFAIGLLVFAIAGLTRANEYLAAFSAGVTIATFGPAVRDRFREFGEILTELLKLAALLAFGALISRRFLLDASMSKYAFVALALILPRPLAMGISLLGSELDRKERAVAAWFGPKGFASVVYAILLLKSGVPNAGQLFQLAALVTAASILAHSSTDIFVVYWFRQVEKEEEHERELTGVVRAEDTSNDNDAEDAPTHPRPEEDLLGYQEPTETPLRR